MGPYRDRSAYDTVMQAYGGFAMNQADPAGGDPTFLRQTAADKVTALFAAQAARRADGATGDASDVLRGLAVPRTPAHDPARPQKETIHG